MVVVTEALSEGSLVAAGSLITRPEILSRALMSGGTSRYAPKFATSSLAGGVTNDRMAAGADPLGDLAKAKTGAAPNEPFTFFVQVGAFRTAEDAEGQRAKLLLSGIESKVTEREQSGRTVFRVRVGPFDKKDDAEKAKDKLDAAGLETALVRVQR